MRAARFTFYKPGQLVLLCGLGALLAVALGCRKDRVQLPPLEPRYDAGRFEPELPDGAVLCKDDGDCDDEIACTRDVCDPLGYCVHGTNSSQCTDGVFCNGPERCDPTVGCVPATPLRCDDGDVCTMDTCDEKEKRCRNDPRDFDGDGEVDWHCFNGTDCDDFDITRAKDAAELCSDGLDNDCDDEVDESRCGRAEHDRCGEALDVSGGGRFEASLLGASADYTVGCGSISARDVTFVLTLEETQDVTIVADGLLPDGTDETATLALRKRCDESLSELECSTGFPPQVRIRALAAGTYFLIAGSDLAAQIVLDVRLEPPTEAPSNLSCAEPLDISAGGHFEGSMVDVGDDESISCGFRNAQDLLYTFTLAEPQDVELSAISKTGERMNLAVRTACGDPESAIRCISAAPAIGLLHELPPGTYYVVLESSPVREVDFNFDVAFLPPTPAPPGDGCTQPLPLAISEEVSGTLSAREDLVDVVCGCSMEQSDSGQSCGLYLPDVVYRIDLEEPTDLGLSVAGAEVALMAYDLRTDCFHGTSQLQCGSGQPLVTRLRNLMPGPYYLVVESPSPTTFTVRVDPLPLSEPVLIEGNETCGSAADIPEEGGLFQGDTSLMFGDYEAVCGGGARSHDAVYRLSLSRSSHVSVALSAVFDTVLYRFSDNGAPDQACQSQQELACNDDGQGSTNSLLDEDLEAGTHYYVIDGFNNANQGRYMFEVEVIPN